jgi:RNA-directed DNA polymerase
MREAASCCSTRQARGLVRRRRPSGESPRGRRVSIVQYADDFVMRFESEADGRRMSLDLKDRLAKFGLSLHEDRRRV